MPWDFDDYRLHFGFTSEYGQSLAELFGKVNGKRIIEFGSGDGSLAARLTAQGAVVVGVESSPSLLALARRDYPDIEFITSDPAQYCPAQPADLVIANSILHLIPFEQQSDTIGAAFAALKEGGHFVAEIGGKGNAAKVFSTVKAACMSRGNHPECRFYTPSLGEFVSLLEQQGFTVEYAVYYARPMMLPAGDGLADWIRMFLELPLRSWTSRPVRRSSPNRSRSSGRRSSMTGAGTSTSSGSASRPSRAPCRRSATRPSRSRPGTGTELPASPPDLRST